MLFPADKTKTFMMGLLYPKIGGKTILQEIYKKKISESLPPIYTESVSHFPADAWYTWSWDNFLAYSNQKGGDIAETKW
jgi:hypothetical protein